MGQCCSKTQPSPSNVPNAPPQRQPNGNFDKKAFCDYVNDSGRAYRFRGKRLIDFCRRFSSASEQSFTQDAKLSSLLAECDKAVKGAVKSRDEEMRPELEALFKHATKELMNYAGTYHLGVTNVEHDMGDAEKEDEKKKHTRWNDSENVDTVDFYICPSPSLPLPYTNATIVQREWATRQSQPVSCSHLIPVPEALSSNSQLEDVLWNFSHFHELSEECLTLTQTPHFYTDLPKVVDLDRATFEGKRITEDYHGKSPIYVLCNNSRRVFFEFGGEKRAFDNIWDMERTFVFRDIRGILENEATVQQSISKPPRVFYRETLTQDQPEEVEEWGDIFRKLRETPRPQVRFSATQ